MTKSKLQGHAEFLLLVKERFPTLRVALEDEIVEGLLHPQMGEFRRFTQEAIERGAFDQVEDCYRLVDVLMENPDSALENALNVSFFEMLTFEGPNGARAWALLPARQQKAWQDMEKYLEDLAAKAEALKVKRPQ